MIKDSDPSKKEIENRRVGTFCFDEYPTYDEWIKQFDMNEEYPKMVKHADPHFGHLPVWIDRNAYFEGATGWKNEKNFIAVNDGKLYLDVVKKDGGYYLDTNIYEILGNFKTQMISTEKLGEAFEPSQKFENPDGTSITFNVDYHGQHRGSDVIPGPFATAEGAREKLF